MMAFFLLHKGHRHYVLLVAAVAVVVLLGVALVAGDVLTRSTHTVPSTFFGMHIHFAPKGTPWPVISFGTLRLWDADVIWAALEPRKGKWRFGKLDTNVDLAEAHKTEVLLTLGQSPTWASARPSEPSAYKPGAAAEPAHIEDWKNYVRTVATRYKGRIHYYEIWNEPNLPGFYSGSIDQMVTLAREAYAILKEVDPAAKVVSPSVTMAQGIPWLEQYFIKGGATYTDIIGYHFYVFPDPPEAMVPLIRNVRQLMTQYGIVGKPLWNTEAGWTKPKLFSSGSEASAYVARAYILNWAAGVDRFYWYAWDNHAWVTLEMTQTDNKTLKPAGIAYGEVRKWIVGAKLLSCGQDSQGTWLAQITRDNGYKGFIIWSPDKTINFAIPKEYNTTQMKDLTGHTTSVTGGSQLSIGMRPVLLENGSSSPAIDPPRTLHSIKPR
jgi:hypothetical protein